MLLRFFLLTLCTAFAALVAVPGQPRPAAADDCLIKPSGGAPQGSHWYYRVDRATGRQCWYLGAEGTRVRPAARTASAPAHPRAAKTADKPADKTAEAPPTQPAAGSTELDTGSLNTASAAAPAELASARSIAADPAAPAFSTGGIGAPKAVAAAAPGAPATALDAQEQSTSVSSTSASADEMPLVWPVLTPEERAAGEQPSGWSFAAHLAGILASVLGLAALLGCLVLRFVSKGNGRDAAPAFEAGVEPGWAGASHAGRPGLYAEFADEAPALAPGDDPAFWPEEPEQESAEDAAREHAREHAPERPSARYRRAYHHQLDELALAPAR